MKEPFIFSDATSPNAAFSVEIIAKAIKTVQRVCKSIIVMCKNGDY